MPIYFDNAAAVPCDPDLLDYWTECARKFPGNQESMGYQGAQAAIAVREAAEKLRKLFQFPGNSEVFFANTGTESLARGVEGVCRTLRSGEILTTALEHPALEKAILRSAKNNSMTVKTCPADRSGISLDRMEEMMSDKTLLVAVHHVQSETGGIVDLIQLRKIMDRQAPRACLLVDTMQSAGKIEISCKQVRPDLIFLSGQKIGAPGGSALLCTKPFTHAVHALRTMEHFSGRCPAYMILTLVQAAENAMHTLPVHYAHAAALKQCLLDELSRNALPFSVTLSEQPVSPYIIHLLTMPYQSAILTRALHLQKISTAPGSACESETPHGSKTLAAMGFPKKECFCGLRISTWKNNTQEEIIELVRQLTDCLKNY